MAFDILLLLLGNIAASTSVIFIKGSQTHPILLAAYRQLTAAVILTPVFFSEAKRHGLKPRISMLKPSVLPGLMLGLHFITWIYGARMTLAANSTLIVNMIPVAMPFLLYFLAGEKVTGLEIFGTALAMLGVFLLAGRDFQPGSGTIAGDLICLVSMVFLSVYMALAKRNNRTPGIWLYVVPLYYIGGLFCFAASLFFTSPLAQPYDTKEILFILGLGIIPTVIGHTVTNRSMLVLRGQIVSLFALFQFAFAAVFGFFLFDERPDFVLIPATILVLTGSVIAIFRIPRGEQGTPIP